MMVPTGALQVRLMEKEVCWDVWAMLDESG